MSCVNENCDKDPLRSINSVLVTMDGDFACSPECEKEYRKQYDHFMNVTIQDERKFLKWINPGG